MQPVVNLKDVRHEFVSSDKRRTLALEQLNLAVQRHEFVALVGPSGCGKSTVLRLVAGLLQPTGGTVEFYGRPLKEPRDEVGLVFQRPTLLPWLSVLANITFPMKHKYGSVDAASLQRAHQLLETVGLTEFAAKLPHELSGGMQQRVGIARALLHDPEVLLMDEPFSALDALTRDELSLELLNILHVKPKTVLFVTHSIPEAVLLADRIVVMSARPGRITDVIDVPFQRPRGLETLDDSRFGELASEIRHKIFAKAVKKGEKTRAA